MTAMGEKSCYNCGVPLSNALIVCVRCIRAPFMADQWIEKKPRLEVFDDELRRSEAIEKGVDR